MTAAFLTCLVLAASPQAGAMEETGTIQMAHVLDALGLDEQHKADVMAGKIVSTDLREVSDKELAISVAMLLPVPVEQVADLVRTSEMLDVGGDVTVFEVLGNETPSEQSCRDMTFVKGDEAEIRAFLAARPGSKFNLASSEFERLQALRKRFGSSRCDRDQACRVAVNAEYRDLLLERLRIYREGGLTSIAPYARDGKNRANPGNELRSSAEAAGVVRDRLPALYRAFVNYPNDPVDGLEHVFICMKTRVQDRPAFVLAHRFVYERPDVVLLAERQFYVGHSYNSLQILAGCYPIGEETIVFYSNRTSTDQVAGFAKAMRHSIGRNRMRDAVVARFEKIRARLE